MYIYQSEGSKNWEPFHICKTKLNQAKGYNKTIKDIPAFLEIIVRIHCDDLEKHFCCEDSSEDLNSKCSCEIPLWNLALV